MGIDSVQMVGWATPKVKGAERTEGKGDERVKGRGRGREEREEPRVSLAACGTCRVHFLRCRVASLVGSMIYSWGISECSRS